MDLATLIDVMVLLGLICVSAVLAAGEFAFFSASRADLAAACDRRSRRLLGMLDRPQELLTSLLVGASISNVMAALFALRIAWRAFPEGGARTVAGVVCLVIVSLVIAIFARLLPRVYAAHNPGAAALNLARPVFALLLPIYPLVKGVMVLTRGLFPAGARSGDALFAIGEIDIATELYRQVGPGSVRVDGTARIGDLNEALKTSISQDGDCDTIAGLLHRLAGRVPAQGEEHRACGLSFLVEKVAGKRIQQVVIKGVDLGGADREA